MRLACLLPLGERAREIEASARDVEGTAPIGHLRLAQRRDRAVRRVETLVELGVRNRLVV